MKLVSLLNYSIVTLLSFPAFTNNQSRAPDWQKFYLERYQLTDTDTKLVDNKGDGFASLYGVRNFRAVLPGLVYRGGANNYYNRRRPRNNHNPIPNEELPNLCKEGFATAVYLYATNYGSALREVACQSVRSTSTHLDYIQKDPFEGLHARTIFKLVTDAIEGKAAGPIYLHCWNGWHASGYISALILRQFCNFTAEEAVAYWDRNTDGQNRSARFNRIRDSIREFVPIAEFTVAATLQQQICPSR